MQARRPALPVIDNARGAKLLLDCSLNDVSLLLLFGRPGAYQVDLYLRVTVGCESSVEHAQMATLRGSNVCV